MLQRRIDFVLDSHRRQPRDLTLIYLYNHVLIHNKFDLDQADAEVIDGQILFGQYIATMSLQEGNDNAFS